jgi:hypothetical protein
VFLTFERTFARHAKSPFVIHNDPLASLIPFYHKIQNKSTCFYNKNAIFSLFHEIPRRKRLFYVQSGNMQKTLANLRVFLRFI